MNVKRGLFVALVLLSGVFLLAACGSSDAEEMAEMDMEHDDHEHEMEHDTEHDMGHMHVDPPDEYASLSNPYAGDNDAVAEGKVIFDTNCATCHGEGGAGDGPAAVGLDPMPANLADAEMMGMIDDAYLFWRVSEGGVMEPFNSAMPTWKDALSETQRWQVVTYVRSLSDS